jgi:hypothetical protein
MVLHSNLQDSVLCITISRIANPPYRHFLASVQHFGSWLPLGQLVAGLGKIKFGYDWLENVASHHCFGGHLGEVWSHTSFIVVEFPDA